LFYWRSENHYVRSAPSSSPDGRTPLTLTIAGVTKSAAVAAADQSCMANSSAVRLVPRSGAEQVKPEKEGKKMVPMHPYLLRCQLGAERQASMLAWARQERMARQARAARRAPADSAGRLSRALRLAA
jgi:hypothetical protein